MVTAYPDSALAWAARAGIEEEQKMLELAEYDYGEALKRDKNNIHYLLNRADIRIRLKKYTEPETILTVLCVWVLLRLL